MVTLFCKAISRDVAFLRILETAGLALLLNGAFTY